MHSAADILQILDDCAEDCTFPMLDNGYVYLAATRLSLFRSDTAWAMVIEVFGFSPRAELPDIHVYTFSNALHARNRPEDYISPEAHAAYLANNPGNESRFFHPIEEGDWQEEDVENVAAHAGTIELRGERVPLASLEDYATYGIELAEPPRIQVFELCRWLAATHRDQVLANLVERRISVSPDMTELLVLDDWHHPDLVNRQVPSQTGTFRQLAEVLVTGDVSRYTAPEEPNTHWRNWPEGGTL